eukprot:m.42891 g.42891  ORF g.42891 m.42891 type:complete len:117 (+) comp17062_c0_seq2:47-397(+)
MCSQERPSTAKRMARHLAAMPVQSTPVSTLSKLGQPELVEKFLTEQVEIAKDVHQQQLQKQLFTAAFWGQHDVVRDLLQQGADPNVQNVGTMWTPLHASAFQVGFPRFCWPVDFPR